MGKFDDLPDDVPASPPATPETLWQQWGLQLTARSGPHINLHNAARILESDPAYKNSVYYDEFLKRLIRVNSPAREWTDADDLEVVRHIQQVLNIPKMGRDAVSQAVIAVAHKRVRNCVKEWLDTLKWDGTPRLEDFFIDFMGADNTEYVRCASKNFWLSMVARAIKPGCKVDTMIVLEGPQGVGKSTSLKIIGGEWFAEQHESAINPKAFAEILQGKLLVEISEMDAFRAAEVSRVKQAISCSSDRFRASYARYAIDYPRTCVFVGTTNKDDWNRDETGARRFWPVACSGNVDLEGIRATRDQLFAEAVVRWRAGEDYWTMPLESTEQEQRSRFQVDPWHDEVVRITKGRAAVTTNEILKELGIELGRTGKPEQTRVGRILKFLGWNRVRETSGISRGYVYKPPM